MTDFVQYNFKYDPKPKVVREVFLTRWVRLAWLLRCQNQMFGEWQLQNYAYERVVEKSAIDTLDHVTKFAYRITLEWNKLPHTHPNYWTRRIAFSRASWWTRLKMAWFRRGAKEVKR